jgi:hypothetical protein
LVATIEWLRLCPNDGPFAQMWQTLDMRRVNIAVRRLSLPVASAGTG